MAVACDPACGALLDPIFGSIALAKVATCVLAERAGASREFMSRNCICSHLFIATCTLIMNSAG
jgi:hypothetical protein